VVIFRLLLVEKGQRKDNNIEEGERQRESSISIKFWKGVGLLSNYYPSKE